MIGSTTEAHCVVHAELRRPYPDEVQPGAAAALGGAPTTTRGNLSIASLEERLSDLRVSSAAPSRHWSSGLVRNAAVGTWDGLHGVHA